MYLYSVKSIEPVRGIAAVTDAQPLPRQTRAKHEAAQDTPKREVKSDKLAELQTILSQHDISMKFSTNDQTNEVVVQLVDDKTGETIRQIPNDVSLHLAAVNIKLQGLLIDESV